MVYLYRCRVCGHEEDVSLSVDEVSSYRHRCTRCGAESARVFRLAGIRFVGSGFHVNDYPSRSGRSPRE